MLLFSPELQRFEGSVRRTGEPAAGFRRPQQETRRKGIPVEEGQVSGTQRLCLVAGCTCIQISGLVFSC